MDTKQKLSLLKKWQETHDMVDKSIKDIEIAFGCHLVESTMFNASWRAFENYTEILSILLKTNEKQKAEDVSDWLSWFCYENDMGKGEMEAKISSWKRMRKIKNIGDLLKVIEG